MSNPMVREVGRIEDIDGSKLVVGVDLDSVTIGYADDMEPIRLTFMAAGEFAQLFVSACWQAGWNNARMTAPAPAAHDCRDALFAGGGHGA